MKKMKIIMKNNNDVWKCNNCNEILIIMKWKCNEM